MTPDKDLFPGFDDTLRRGDAAGDRAVLRARPAEQPQRAGAARLRLHLPQRGVWRGITGSTASRATSSGRCPLADRRRGGVLTQASVLTLTSNPNRTSPVKRGQWILQQLLGTPPPPPPPDVAQAGREQAGRRRRLAPRADGGAPGRPEVRVVPSADGPAGLRPGELRRGGPLADQDGEFPIDPSGELIGRPQVRRRPGAEAAPRARRPPRNSPGPLIKNMLTYGLGRGPGSLRLLHGRGDPRAARRRRLPDPEHRLRDRGEPGLPVSGRRPMIAIASTPRSNARNA